MFFSSYDLAFVVEMQETLFLDWKFQFGADNMNIGDWVRKWAAIQPDKTAVIFEESSFTYEELSARANQLAKALRKKGTQKGDRVGRSFITQRSTLKSF